MILKATVVITLLSFLLIVEVTTEEKKIVFGLLPQKFRSDYRNFRKESLKAVDRSFFDFYNTLDASLSEILKPFERVKKKWKKMCKSYQLRISSNETSLLFSTICKKQNDLLEDLIAERENLLMELFGGEIIADSSSTLTMKNLFYDMEQQMKMLWKMFYNKTSCVEPLIDEYLPSFEPLVTHVCFLNSETSANVDKMFVNLKPIVTKNVKPMIILIGRVMKECAKSHTETCILFFVSVLHTCS